MSLNTAIFHRLRLNTKTSSVQADSLLARAAIPNDRDLRKSVHNKVECRGKVVPVDAMKAHEIVEV